jgi:hypothetical protein
MGCVNPWAIVRLEGLGQLKMSVTSRIELPTFRLAAEFHKLLQNFVPSLKEGI